MRLAANAGPKKVASQSRHLGTIPQLCRAICSQLWHVSIIGKKNLLSSNISSTCLHNMANFGRLAAEILSLVWGTRANFNGFRVSASLLHSQTAALNRGRHLYSARRPSCWAPHWPTFLVLSSFFLSSPNFSRRRLDVCHTSTHGVALVRI